ncbi:Trans-aconitate 2-methyltransferase [Podospora fimiseda]|uniref:Trans-aconitate 2-methyltransferase n=1 Tax=Podospora fimiseda TaxID=252190 RepID=A0AAN7BVG3_9PEZI|nr:Trans-aconitate 2-methyltransferase [Podospora fimiseda]
MSRSGESSATGGAPSEVINRTLEAYQENGRWYGGFKRGRCMTPVDEPELERLDILHKLFSVLRKEALHSAPLANPTSPRIMDVGCGTGIWGIDMADKYPLGHVLGIDLNFIQPEYIPSNIRFIQRDVEAPWQDLEPGTWDLIHLRMLNGNIASWPTMYNEVYRHLTPYHGHIEHVEVDWFPRTDEPGVVIEGTPIHKWANELLDVMDNLGRQLRVESNLIKQRLADAGFTDIKEEVLKVPYNAWSSDRHERELGRWFDLSMRTGYQALSLAPFARGLSRSAEEINAFIEQVYAQTHSKEFRAYVTVHVFTARKPQ